MTTANKIVGVANDVRIDQEGRDVVLRFVVQSSEGDRVPVEMRGNAVRGVLESGDRVALIGTKARDRDGVARPRLIEDQTTSSTIHMARTNFIAKALGFVLRVIVVLALGAASILLFQYLVDAEMVSLPSSLAIDVAPWVSSLALLIGLGVTHLSLAAVLVGLAVMLLSLIWISTRRRRPSGNTLATQQRSTSRPQV
jgi:hypothetical protein